METTSNAILPMSTRKILFSANAVRWFDKVNGNTYHSVRVTQCEDGQTIACPYQYGYGDCYRQTALEAMHKAGWLPAQYGEKYANGSSKLYQYEMENGYPILWHVSEGKKRECVANGTL
jgi:hypothetical protein